MTLDRSTYEAWLLDRLEGNLTPAQERELDAFLAAHPDLPATLDELPDVGDVQATFHAKDLLKKEYPPAGSPDASRLNDFLVARLEKGLSAEQEKQLDRYLFEHPEAAQDAKRMAASRIAPYPIAFAAKATVERRFPPHGLPDKHRLTDFLIAADEGDLDAQQRTGLENYITTHPEAAHERRLVKAARIDRTPVVFAHKEALKKREGRVIALWPRLAAAASIALLLGLGWWMMRGHSDTEAGIAKNEQPKPVTPAVPTEKQKEQEGMVPREMKKEEAAPAEREQPNGATSSEGKRTTTRPAVVPNAVPQEKNAPAQAPASAPQPEPQPYRQAPEPEQQLAQAPQSPATAPAPSEGNAPAITPGKSGKDETLGTYMANAVRNEVLNEPERKSGLDGNDAVAAVDKGLSALTGGQGGVQVQRTGARERVHVKFGRSLAISASRGR